MSDHLSDIKFGDAGTYQWGEPMLATDRKMCDVDTYVRDAAVSGIKVAPEYVNRMIPKDTDLNEVFTPRSDVSVYCLNVFPGSDDVKLYERIMQEVSSGDAFIDSIDKHPTENGFVILLVVDRTRMVFRKDSYNELFPPMEMKHE